MAADASKQLDEQQLIALSAQIRRQRVNKNVGGRTSFIPPSDSPGPAAYDQNVDPIKYSTGRTVFGSGSRYSDAKRYLSRLHAEADCMGVGSPGPGTYRVMLADKYPHSPKRDCSPTFKFGTAAQRPDDETRTADRSPGPIYHPSMPGHAPPAWSFAPQGELELGMQRQRSDGQLVYISPEHSMADRGTAPGAETGVGPGQYDTITNMYSVAGRKKPAGIKFGQASRDAKNSYDRLQLAAEPGSGTALQVPGAQYDMPSAVSPKSMKFGTGRRSFSPEPGGGGAGPYISRLHEFSQRGMYTPGPGAYSVPNTVGDSPGYSFGTGPQCAPVKAAMVPGPGAHNAKIDPLSRSQTAPAYTIGPAVKGDQSTERYLMSIPGPGAYDVVQASQQDASKHKSGSFSMYGTGPCGRNSFVPSTIGPGPAAYSVTSTPKAHQKRGYSFGMREKTVDPKSTVTVRYYGPLAAQEALGTQSPGPGLYDTRTAEGCLSPTRRAPDVAFGSAPRLGTRNYIGKLHAEADCMGTDSPGPTAYNHGAVELAEVTSRYRKPPSTCFSASPRFKMNYMTY